MVLVGYLLIWDKRMGLDRLKEAHFSTYLIKMVNNRIINMTEQLIHGEILNIVH